MSTLFKKISLAALAAVAVIGSFAMNIFQNNDEQPSADTLIVGLQSGYPPFEYMDKDGNIIGFDPDVAKLIAAQLGKKLVIKDMEFEGEILSLKQGKIDLIISGMNITQSRQKEILMVPYHGEDDKSMTLIFWKEIPEGVHSLQDIASLPNPIVSVETGAIPEEYISKYPKIQAKSFQDALSSLMDVKYGKSVANLVEPDVAEYLKMQHPEIKLMDVPLAEDVYVLGFGIGINKQNQILYQQIQKIIQEVRASGELKKLEDKWFKGAE